MNHRQFDNFTRNIASAADRRHFLKAFFGGAVALVGLRNRGAAQQDCRGSCPEGEICGAGGCFVPCENDRDCRSKHDDPCVSMMCSDGACLSTIIDCLPGYECCEGECCPRGCDTDSECAVLDPCTWGTCGSNGHCEFLELDSCVSCATDAECMNNGNNTVCCENYCRRPCPDGTMMGKACECQVGGVPSRDGIFVRDDASG